MKLGYADAPVRRDELAEVFRRAEKGPERFLIGAEGEKFAVRRETGEPLTYDGEFGVCRIFRHLGENHGWTPYREREGGPVLALLRERASITLEPSVQFELSGAPLPDVHAIDRELREHFRELAPVAAEMGLEWLMTGFHPLAERAELPWVPKERYPIMREYLPSKGTAALDMMQRTATVQANYDYSSEADALRKLRVTLRLGPLVHALFANSPFEAGRRSEFLSRRGVVWMNMDPSRSGLVPPVWKRDATYDDYVEWALDAGMFLFRRGERFVRNTGQTFRDFLENGFQGHRATLEDFAAHLATLFPEVRLKSTLEVRSIDAQQPALGLAMIALYTGILYDERALAETEALVEGLRPEQLEEARPRLVRHGPREKVAERSAFSWGEALVEIARGGLERRGRLASGVDESAYLRPLGRLLELRLTPAEEDLARVEAGASLVEATRLRGLEDVS